MIAIMITRVFMWRECAVSVKRCFLAIMPWRVFGSAP